MTFDRFSTLDPAKMLRDINEAADPDVPFDQFSLLDPERARRQIETALGIQIDSATMLDPARFYKVVEQATGDTDEEPPVEDPEILIDFENGVYTVDGVSVAVTSLFGSDPIFTVNPWTDEKIQSGVGLENEGDPNSQPTFIGEALSRLLSGATVIMDVTFSGFGQVGLDLHTSDYAFEADAGIRNGYVKVDDYIGSIQSSDGTPIDAGRLLLALNISPTHLAVSSNVEMVAIDTVTPVTPTDVGIVIPNTLGHIIHSIRIVTAVADEDLQTLLE